MPVLRYNIRRETGFPSTLIWDTRTVGINTRLEDKDLLAEINKHLGDLKSIRVLDKIEKKWLGGGAS